MHSVRIRNADISLKGITELELLLFGQVDFLHDINPTIRQSLFLVTHRPFSIIGLSCMKLLNIPPSILMSSSLSTPEVNRSLF